MLTPLQEQEVLPLYKIIHIDPVVAEIIYSFYLTFWQGPDLNRLKYEIWSEMLSFLYIFSYERFETVNLSPSTSLSW